MTVDLVGTVAALVSRARAAREGFAGQESFDRAAQAAAWALVNPANNRRLCARAVAETGLGNAADKALKNRRKTLGLLRDLRGVKTTGVVRDCPERGLTEIARPVGVVGALTPSTNPLATPANNAVNALKCGNALIFAPPPKGAGVCAELLALMRAELAKCGLPPDLLQMLPAPPSKEMSSELMRQVDLVVVTGSQRNVRAAYASGTPALGVGAGNVAVIVDETADLPGAAAKIRASKTFDNATSCSSENALIVVDAVWDETLAALQAEGGRLLNAAQKEKLQNALWQDGALNRAMIAKDLPVFLREAGLEELLAEVDGADKADEADGRRFVMVEEDGVGGSFPFSGEKLSLALALYRAADFDAAVARAGELLAHQGGGHSVGIHTQAAERPLRLGLELPACRVIVNQAHCFAAGGSLENALPFSLSMGCGTWGGNSFSDNLHYRHFLNTVRVVRPIAPTEVDEEELFADYRAAVGP